MLKITTYNVQNLFVDKCTDARKECLRNVIASINADVLCLQEVADKDLLADITPEYEYRYMGTPDIRGSANAVVSHLPMHCSSVPYDYAATGYIASAALASPMENQTARSAVRVEVETGRGVVTLLNIHLRSGRPMNIHDPQGNNIELTTQARLGLGRVRAGLQQLAQAYSLRLYLDALFADSQNALIAVLGDFNSELHSVITRIIQGDTEFSDAPGVMQNLANKIHQESVFTLKNKNGSSRMVDFCVVSPSLVDSVANVRIANDYFIDGTQYDDLPSDHAPLVVEFDLG